MAFLMDDELRQDPRFRRLRTLPNFADAFAMYALVGIECASKKSDGRLYRSDARGLLPSASKAAKALDALVSVGFLEEDPTADEYLFVRFTKEDGGLNESYARSLDRRSMAAARQGRKRERTQRERSTSRDVTRDVPREVTRDVTAQSRTPLLPSPNSPPEGERPPTPLDAKGKAGLATAAVIRGYGGPLPGKQISRAQREKLFALALVERPNDPDGALEALGKSLRGNASDPWLIAVKDGFGAMVDEPSSPADDPELTKLEHHARELRSRLEYGEISDPNERIRAEEDLARMDAGIATRKRNRKAAA